MELTKEELSAGRRRLFQLIIGNARKKYLRAHEAVKVNPVSTKMPGIVRKAPVASFFDMAQDSFNFRN